MPPAPDGKLKGGKWEGAGKQLHAGDPSTRRAGLWSKSHAPEGRRNAILICPWESSYIASCGEDLESPFPAVGGREILTLLGTIATWDFAEWAVASCDWGYTTELGGRKSFPMPNAYIDSKSSPIALC